MVLSFSDQKDWFESCKGLLRSSAKKDNNNSNTNNSNNKKRKAFDSLEWPFIMETLNSFNFGTSIKQWISTFYTNLESTVINNGYATNWFQPSKGVRQECPLSPYLFILSAEILPIRIRSDPTVKGINLFGNELKLSQFAEWAPRLALRKRLKVIRKWLIENGYQTRQSSLLYVFVLSFGLDSAQKTIVVYY